MKTKENPEIYSNKNIWAGSNRTANFVDINHRLPAVVGINGKNVNMNDMLYLMCKSLNTTTGVTLGKYVHVLSDSGTNYPNTTFTKEEYLLLSDKIATFYEKNNRNFKTLKFKNVTMNFDDTVYMFARIGRYKHVNKKFPDNITLIALYNEDYSTDSNALQSTSKNHFTITTNCKDLGNGKYNITLKASETTAIYYTINGSIPTNSSNEYSKTLTINNKTWLRFFGINSNNEKTPLLSYGINRATLPYITSKTKLLGNGYENCLNISAAEPSTIYYTLNGSKPTTKSFIYKNSLTIHNNSLLQYFAITTRNKKQSPVYYYKLQNPTPYVTILNLTDVRDNTQNITLIGNKPGKIYYTTNGNNPTKNDNLYSSGKILKIHIKTVITAILIDENDETSKNVSYKPPRTVTPSIPIISPSWNLDYKTQIITFNFNKITQKICYTTDNSNPKNSSTRKWITLNSTSYEYLNVGIGKTLKFYTISEEGYYSGIYNYTVPQSPYAIANIKIINLSNIYNDGTQKIGIQMDQNGEKSVIINNESPQSLGTYNEITTNENSIIKIKIINDNSNRINEYIYTRESGLKYVMNYHYKMKIPYQKLKIKKKFSGIRLI